MATVPEIRVLIVDDNMLIRSATKMVLNTSKDFIVVGEAADGLTGIKMALELEPDIVLMDINMTPVNGIQATRTLLSQTSSIIVIGFSALPHKHEEKEMIDAGATGVINKSSTREIICQEIIHYYNQRIIQKKPDGDFNFEE